MRALMNVITSAMAILGGIVLTILVFITCLSVVGRGLNSLAHSDLVSTTVPALSAWLLSTGVGPIGGDFELVQAGMAFTIFAFLPLCQFRSEHATVDIFTNPLPNHLNVWIGAFWEFVLAIVIALIAWRLFVGLNVKFGNSETSMFLQFPIWWGYAASFSAAFVAALVGVYCAIGRVVDVVTGSHWLPDDLGTRQ